jgi:hypothetical protein
MIDYTKFPGLTGVYLEDSYVLEILEEPGELIFKLDAVLTPECPAYRPPRPDEQYCYAAGCLVFPSVLSIDWIERTDQKFTDASGEQDLGNIDVLKRDGDFFVAEGDWGKVRVQSAEPQFELDD